MLSALFMVSHTTIEREIRFLLPMPWTYFRDLVRWPTPEQWLEIAHDWEYFPGAVGAIDGTRHEIQRPQTEPQQHFYSGHCRYHNFSTQIIMDGRGNIVYIHSGFLGLNNDSAQLQMMPRSDIEKNYTCHKVYTSLLTKDTHANTLFSRHGDNVTSLVINVDICLTLKCEDSE